MRSFCTMMMFTLASGLLLVMPAPGSAQTTVKDELDAAKAADAAKDFQGQLRHLTAACDKGSAESCLLLGESFRDGGNAAQKASAPVFLEKACSAGNAASCHNAAIIYINGSGVAKDTGRAVPLLEKACALNIVVSCDYAALVYYKGDGITKDAARALPLFEKACASGILDSCAGAANILIEGDGVAQDKAKAARLYEQSCIGGDGPACLPAARFYTEGDGVATDEAHAFKLFDMGCNAKSANACNLAGLFIQRQMLKRHRDSLISDFQATARKFCKGLDCSKVAVEMVTPASKKEAAAARAKSIGYFQKALAIDPNDELAKKHLAEDAAQ